MAVKRYGIFLAYPPTTTLQAEGLGRYLASFVKAATDQSDNQIVIASPSWLRGQLRQLFNDSGVSEESYTFVGPTRAPLLLRLYIRSKKAHRPRRLRARHWLVQLRDKLLNHLRWAVFSFSSSSNPFVFLLFAFYLTVIAIIGIPFLLIFSSWKAVLILRKTVKKSGIRVFGRYKPRVVQLKVAISRFKLRLPQRSIRSMLFSAMHSVEIRKMVSIINRTYTEMAWYSPAAFWPGFNDIKAPKLMCVPDIVLYEFPVQFAGYGEAIARGRREILSAVDGGADLVTYSEHIKWETLVKKLNSDPSKVWVVRHAPSTLSRYTEVTGFADNDSASLSLNRAIALGSMSKITGSPSLPLLKTFEFKYIFYASQFRPSKNVITLLRAYEFLLRKRYIKQKLVLTGRGEYGPVKRFVEKHNLHNDVLFLHGLTEPELAAAYKCADLAVNPSLAEGGMPFTITEALSVGTPVVMGDIEVTREVIKDRELRQITLFDPYDWRSMADKIEWAIANKAELYEKQRIFFDDVLASRDWSDVVSEHFTILDDIYDREVNRRGAKFHEGIARKMGARLRQ